MAVLSDQLSARLVHAMSKYGALADITLPRFDVRIIYMLRVRYRHPKYRGPRVNATAMSCYSVVHHVYHGTSSRRDRELKYSSQPIAKDQATRTPKAWISDGDSSLCGPSKTLKLMTVPLTQRCSNFAKASLYKQMTPQLLNVKLAGSPKRKAYSYIYTKKANYKNNVRACLH